MVQENMESFQQSKAFCPCTLAQVGQCAAAWNLYKKSSTSVAKLFKQVQFTLTASPCKQLTDIDDWRRLFHLQVSTQHGGISGEVFLNQDH